jgi:3'(2'), 5'-bisphosphate nucleotidase
MNTSDDLRTLSDDQVSRVIACAAGALLLSLRESFGPIDDRARADELRHIADREAHELIAERLQQARPQDALLSEEGIDGQARLTANRVWIVDPLDGTWEYGQGRVDFAVHIALWHADRQEVSACTVDLPAQGLTRTMLDPVPSNPLPADRPIRLVASRTRPPANLTAVADTLGGLLAQAGLNTHGVQVVDVGSVGAKVNEILAGRAEGYVHDTGFSEWDVAAPYGVARHYRLAASHLDGSPVHFNAMPPRVADLVVAHPDLMPLLRQSLDAHS